MKLKLFNWSKKETAPSPRLEQRNRIAPSTRESFVDFLLGRNKTELAALVLSMYYFTCAPLGTAVDLTIQGCSNIEPSVWNKRERKFEEEPHPILALLDNPNASQSYDQFIERLCGLFMIHGEVFVIATGDINKEPLEIWPVSRAAVTIEEGVDGFTRTITVNNGNGSISEKYYRHDVNGKFRYYNRRDSSNSITDREIFQIRNFNPLGAIIPLRGRSQLQSIYYEIEQWLASGKHNLSLLLRGATPSGIFTTKSELEGISDEQYERLKEQLINYWDGSENAGRSAFLTDGVEFNQMSQSNKDLDFVESREKIQKDIYNRLKIPLPLVSEKTMTLANLQAAAVLLYDNAIQPLLSRMYRELSILLLYRYEDSENLVLRIDEGQIALLAQRRNEKAISMKETGATSINDRRKEMNLSQYDHGADLVRGSTTEAPVASDDAADLVVEATPDDPQPDDATVKFIQLMQQQIDNNGNQKFEDEDILKISQEDSKEDGL